MLKKFCVHIDNFRVKKDYSCKTAPAPLLLLTHAHADHHGRSISKFTNVVCSATTAFILGTVHEPQIVEPGQTYKHSDDVVFTVFETIHSPGSVGFYFHSPINVLHVGDSRVDSALLETITNIISMNPHESANKLTINGDRDDLKHHNVFKSYPSVETSRRALFELWEKYGADKLVVAMHSDSLCLLLNDIFTPVLLPEDEDVPAVRKTVLTAMSLMPNTKRRILVCGRLPRNNNFADDHPNYVFVEPSLLWFVNDKLPREPTLVSKDKRGVYRIFASGHASQNETRRLLEAVKNIAKA
jgi:hypothetical protein